jgi:hypothetical protein
MDDQGKEYDTYKDDDSIATLRLPPMDFACLRSDIRDGHRINRHGLFY